MEFCNNNIHYTKACTCTCITQKRGSCHCYSNTTIHITVYVQIGFTISHLLSFFGMQRHQNPSCQCYQDYSVENNKQQVL